MPANDSIIIAIHNDIIGLCLLNPVKLEIFSMKLLLYFKASRILKIAMLVIIYMDIYIPRPLIPEIFAAAKPINTYPT